MIARESRMQLSDLMSDFDEQLTSSDLIAVIHELHKHVKIGAVSYQLQKLKVICS